MTGRRREGVCPQCGRRIPLTKTGLIRRHGAKDGRPPADCAGSGQPIATVSQQVALGLLRSRP